MVEDDDALLQPLASVRPDVVRRPYPLLRPDELTGWIGQRARQHDVEMRLDVCRELADLVGPNLRQLDQEIAKLAASAPVGGTITLEDVRELVSGMAPDVFKLHDGIAEGGVGTALSAAHALVESGSEPMQLFAHATGLIRRLLVTKELARERRIADAASFGLSTSRFTQDKLRRQAERFSTSQLIDAYQKLLDMDLAIKTGRIEAELALELVVAELAGLEPGPQFEITNEEDTPWLSAL
jgi:DNA polymerase-3 subunit delta